MVLLNRAVEHAAYPEDQQFVRVSDYASKMVVKPHSSFFEVRLFVNTFLLPHWSDTQLPKL